MSGSGKKNKKRKRRNRRIRKEIVLFSCVFILALLILLIWKAFLGGRSHDSSTHVIMLDAAHGGDASGYQGLISEDEYNEQVISRLEVLLEEDSRFIPVRTHTADQAMSAASRVEVINAEKPDLVLSVRCHNGDSPNFWATLIFADPPSSKYHAESAAFAQDVLASFTDVGVEAAAGYYYLRPIKEGYYQEHLVVLDDETVYEEETYDLMRADASVVIVSQINVNSSEETEFWASEEGIDKAAQIYYDAIVKRYE